MHEAREPQVKPFNYKATVEEIQLCGRGLWRIQCHANTWFNFIPGQVIRVLNTHGDAYLALSSSPVERPKFVLLLRLLEGDVSPLPLEVGQTFVFDGPWGKGFDLPDVGSLWLIGAGSALGALRSVWRSTPSLKGLSELRIIAAVKDPEVLCFADELSALEEAGAKVHIVLSRFPAGEAHITGHVQDHLAHWLAEGSPTRVCVVGSESFEDDVRASLVDLGLPDETIQLNYRADARDLKT